MVLLETTIQTKIYIYQQSVYFGVIASLSCSFPDAPLVDSAKSVFSTDSEVQGLTVGRPQ